MSRCDTIFAEPLRHWVQRFRLRGIQPTRAYKFSRFHSRNRRGKVLRRLADPDKTRGMGFNCENAPRGTKAGIYSNSFRYSDGTGAPPYLWRVLFRPRNGFITRRPKSERMDQRLICGDVSHCWKATYLNGTEFGQSKSPHCQNT